MQQMAQNQIETKEEWRVIKDFPDYAVSSLGKVKRIVRVDNSLDGKILNESKNSGGYFWVGLYKNKKRNHMPIHRLVYNAFIDKKLEKDECIHHIDKNKTNNNVNNLSMMPISTHISKHGKGKIISDEHKDRLRECNTGKIASLETRKKISQRMSSGNHPLFGSKKPGEKSGNHKLTNNDVLKIRELLKNKLMTQKQIANIYKIKQSTVSLIKIRKTWSHI